MLIDKPFNGIYKGEDVEAEAKQYIAHFMDYTNGGYPKVDRAADRINYPNRWNISARDIGKLKTNKERKRWKQFWTRERQRIKQGYGNMSGLHYLYYNYYKFHGGKSYDADFRQFDNWILWLIDSFIQGKNLHFDDHRGNGLLFLKRRQMGWSCLQGGIIEWVALNWRNTDIMVTSKTEEDAQKVVMSNKFMFAYDRLPLPLRPSVLGRSNSLFEIARWEGEGGNKVKKGRNIKIIPRASVHTALEGFSPLLWIHDEAPKTRNLIQLVRKSLPALKDKYGQKLLGLPIIGGVTEDVDALSQDFFTLWRGASSYDLVRVFAPGWISTELDEYGNEDKYAAVKFILKQRRKLLENKDLKDSERESELTNLQQQYPLTVEEAFQVSGASKFDKEKIQRQITLLDEYPVDLYRYKVEWSIEGVSLSVNPSGDGKVLVLEPPVRGARYVCGVDPYGLKQKDLGSDGCMWVYKLDNTSLSNAQVQALLLDLDENTPMDVRREVFCKIGGLPVAFYSARFPSPRDFAKHCAALNYWYWQGSGHTEPCQVAIETEPGDVLNYFLEKYKHMTMNEPIKVGQPAQKRNYTDFGITKKSYWVGVALESMGDYVKNRCDRLFFPELLRHFLTYDETHQSKKHDTVDAFGNTLIGANEPRTQELLVQLPTEKVNVSAGRVFKYARKRGMR